MKNGIELNSHNVKKQKSTSTNKINSVNVSAQSTKRQSMQNHSGVGVSGSVKRVSQIGNRNHSKSSLTGSTVPLEKSSKPSNKKI